MSHKDSIRAFAEDPDNSYLSLNVAYASALTGELLDLSDRHGLANIARGVGFLAAAVAVYQVFPRPKPFYQILPSSPDGSW